MSPRASKDSGILQVGELLSYHSNQLKRQILSNVIGISLSIAKIEEIAVMGIRLRKSSHGTFVLSCNMPTSRRTRQRVRQYMVR